MKKIMMIALITMLTFAEAAGLEKANTLLEDIESGLKLLTITIVTLAVMFVGYKLLFDKHTAWRDLIHVIVGAIVLASASEIAQMFL